MTGRLAGKRIIITGAIGNIGKEAVRAFVAEGAKVVFADINAEAGAAVAAEFGPPVKFIAVDVTREDSVAALIEGGVAWLGGLDVLCQNAGLQHSGPIVDFDAGRRHPLQQSGDRFHGRQGSAARQGDGQCAARAPGQLGGNRAAVRLPGFGRILLHDRPVRRNRRRRL